jgi:hypothetical protein
MTTFIIKKTIEMAFQIEADNWTIEDAENIGKYIDDSDAYHSIVYYSAIEIKDTETA